MFRKLRQQRPPRRISESGKGAVERGAAKLNHLVKYKAGAATVKPRAEVPCGAADIRKRKFGMCAATLDQRPQLHCRLIQAFHAAIEAGRGIALTVRSDVVTLLRSIQN